MITGLAALNKMNRTDPGDDIRVVPGWRNAGNNGGNGGNGGGNAKPDMLDPFMPGQQNLLADQLNTGFGGGMGQWKKFLDQIYSPLALRPFSPSKPPAGGGGGGQGDVVTEGEGPTVVGPDGRPTYVTGQSSQPKNSGPRGTRNPNVPNVTGLNYPGDYTPGLIALRGRS